jgi:hypothetical protein
LAMSVFSNYTNILITANSSLLDMYSYIFHSIGFTISSLFDVSSTYYVQEIILILENSNSQRV